jgi:DNA-binding response OmpR family regulator
MQIRLIYLSFQLNKATVAKRTFSMTSEAKLVLIVDDEEDLRDILLMYVEEIGFKGICAENGEAGLAMALSNPVDVIISDLTMPKLNGISFLRQVREKGFKLPFIVLTGNGTKSTAMEAVRLGAFDFIEKPFVTGHLKALLTDAMEKSKSQQSILSTGKKTVASEIRLPDLGADLGNSWDNGSSKEEFIELYDGQLDFCKGSVKIVLDRTEQIKELGFLYRVIKSCSQAARHWHFYDLSSIAFELSELLLFYRAHPDSIRPENAQLIVKSINNMINIFHNLQDLESVMSKSFAVKKELEMALGQLPKET